MSSHHEWKQVFIQDSKTSARYTGIYKLPHLMPPFRPPLADSLYALEITVQCFVFLPTVSRFTASLEVRNHPFVFSAAHRNDFAAVDGLLFGLSSSNS